MLSFALLAYLGVVCMLTLVQLRGSVVAVSPYSGTSFCNRMHCLAVVCRPRRSSQAPRRWWSMPGGSHHKRHLPNTNAMQFFVRCSWCGTLYVPWRMALCATLSILLITRTPFRSIQIPRIPRHACATLLRGGRPPSNPLGTPAAHPYPQVVVTTLRKMATLLVSFLVFPKPLTPGHLAGVALVFSGVLAYRRCLFFFPSLCC